jgi:hypothetical protein
MNMTPGVAAWQGIFCDAVHLENEKGRAMQIADPHFLDGHCLPRAAP